MNAVAVGLIAVGTLLVLYVAAKTSQTPERNPFIHARDASMGGRDQTRPEADKQDDRSNSSA